tara:strand:- start:924 stop:1172 length:249 start_codon:yes stop_codon:yes gene_type:complete
MIQLTNCRDNGTRYQDKKTPCKIYINTNYIIYFEAYKDSPDGGGNYKTANTIIQLTNQWFLVTETVEEITKKIELATDRNRR